MAMSTQELSSSDFPTILQFSILVARKAGTLILQGSEAITSIEGKANSVDLVTEYDVRVEELVKSEFKAQYPDFGLCVYSTFHLQVQ